MRLQSRKQLITAILVIVSFFLVCPLCHAKAQDMSSEEEETSEAVQDAEDPIPTRMVTKKDGYTYILDDFNDKMTSQFVEWKGKTYYTDKKGRVVKGWKKIKGSYYFFSRKNGKMQSGKTVDGIKLKKDGAAKATSYNKKKIETMITARKIMEKHTKPGDTKNVKLKKCFRWLFQFPYHRYRTLKSGRKHSGWEMKFANDIFQRKDGCCVSEACAFAFLAKECGARKVYVCDDTGHAWTEISGRVYDPLFAEAKSFRGNYNVSYRTYRLHAVNRTKI